VFELRSPTAWKIAALTTAAAWVSIVFAIPVSTQGQGNRRARAFVNGYEVVAGEVIVKLRNRPGVVANRADIEAQADADESEAVGRQNFRRLHSRRLKTEELIASLRNHPDVEYAEPNYVLSTGATPNDPSFGSLWGLLNTGQIMSGQAGTPGVDIGATTAWNTSTGSRSNVVGVVDTGVDYNHPDLAANIWSAPAQFNVTIAGQTITCAAGTHGFNAITKTCDPMDDNMHGTHVSGTIGATGNNGVGVVGVNWTASIMGLKFLGSNGSGSTVDAINAIEFAIQAKAAFGATANVRVLSNSWGGGGFSQALLDEINSANTANMLFVAAAGNSAWDLDSTPSYPASYNAANIVAVAATDNKDQLASFSNYGATSVHLGAPGVTIVSTLPNNSYGGLNGTSMATPHVSGAAALVLSSCTLTTAQLKTALLTSVDLVSALANKTTTGGRLNVGRAIQGCGQPRVATVTLSADKTAPQAPGTTINWTAVASGGTTPYQYKWWVYDGATWANFGWTVSNTFAWTPATANANYQVFVWARSAWDSNDTSEAAANSPAFPIAAPRVPSVTIAANKTAPQAPGTTITWTATAAAGGTAPYQYKWWVYDGASWTNFGWSASNTFAWTPATTANYSIFVWAKSNGNAADTYEAQGSAPFAITAPRVPSVTISADKTAPQAPGTTITWTATAAAGGTAPYQYKWWVYDGASWTNFGWSASTTFAWTPVSNANYSIFVWAKSNGNAADAAEAQTSAPFAITAPRVPSVTIAANKTAPQAPGTTVTWTATAAAGGTAPYQYKWWVYDGANWANFGWSASNTFAWTPVANASYSIFVWAKSNGNAVDAAEAQASAPFAIAASTVPSVTIAANKTAPQAPGTTITWTATAAAGGTAPYQYKWWVYDGANWTNFGWGASNTFAWTPVSNANYTIFVWAKSNGNAADTYEAQTSTPFAIAAPTVPSVTIAANKTAPQAPGTTVTWTATAAAGGTAPYQYKWWVYDGANWANFGWSASNTFAWTPGSANPNYVIFVWVKSAGNAADAAEAAVNSPPYIIR
jgi:subtilisin family serine protease